MSYELRGHLQIPLSAGYPTHPHTLEVEAETIAKRHWAMFPTLWLPKRNTAQRPLTLQLHRWISVKRSKNKKGKSENRQLLIIRPKDLLSICQSPFDSFLLPSSTEVNTYDSHFSASLLFTGECACKWGTATLVLHKGIEVQGFCYNHPFLHRYGFMFQDCTH